jgi:hypothetical protein
MLAITNPVKPMESPGIVLCQCCKSHGGIEKNGPKPDCRVGPLDGLANQRVAGVARISAY